MPDVVNYEPIVNICTIPKVDTKTTALPSYYTTTQTVFSTSDAINILTNQDVGKYITCDIETINNLIIKALSATKIKEVIAHMRFSWSEVEKIEVLSPGKVVRVTLASGKSYKQICRKGDNFSLHFAVALALVKDMGLNLTPTGNEYYANLLSYYKDFNKVIDRGIKKYYRDLREEEKKKAREDEIKAIKARRRAKAAAKRARKKEARS